MREGVVADNVAGLDDFAGDFRTLPHIASNQKKSRVHVVLGENFQQAQRVRIVGAVVVGQRDLPRSARQSREGSPIPLPRRRHGLITRGNGGRGGDGSQGEGEHAGIVNCRLSHCVIA